MGFVGSVSKEKLRTYRPPDLPDISGVEMWPDAPWNFPLEGEVDAKATAALGKESLRTNHGLRGQGGVPYQFAETTATAVRTDVVRYGIRKERVPHAAVTRRTGDPNDANTDRQAFLFDGRTYTEMSSLNNTIWGRAFGATLQLSSVARWDLDKPYDAQGVKGLTGAKLPLVPFIARPEEFAAGHIGHAQMISVRNYQPDRWLGYAMSTDARRSVLADVASPLVCGMRWRLRRERFEHLVELFAECPDIVTELIALRSYGVVVADLGEPGLRLPQTGQIDLQGLSLQFNDFEVIR